MSTYEELASAVLGQDATPQAVSDLTVCFSYGNGAMHIGNSRRGLLVLDRPDNAMKPRSHSFRPVLVECRLQLPPRHDIGTVRFVGNRFRLTAANLGDARPQGYDKAWAPVATRSSALVPIAGPLNNAVATTPDTTDPQNTFEWRDLSVVPVGGLVYRVTRNKCVAAFQRLTNTWPDLWVYIRAGGRRDFGELHSRISQSPPQGTPTDVRTKRPLAYNQYALLAHLNRDAP